MYIKDNNGTPVEYTLRQLKLDNPNISFPSILSEELLAGFNVYPVVEETLPIFDPSTHKVVEGIITNIAEVWTQTWDIVLLTTTEVESIEDAEDSLVIRGDATVKSLILARPAGIESYINTNVTDLATAKEVLIVLAKAVSALGKQAFR